MNFTEAALAFVKDTCRTEQSRTSTMSTLRQLHASRPSTKLGQFTAVQLTNFVLANDPSPNTVKARRARVMGFFAWCTWQKLIAHNPASELKFTAKAGKGGGVRQHTWLSIAEFKKLLEAQPITLEGERARIALLLGGTLGLRRTEIANLRWSDFSHGFARVKLLGKGGKIAELGVPKETQGILAAWSQLGAGDVILPVIVQREPDYPTSSTDFVFVFDWSHPLGSSAVAKIVTEAGKVGDIHLECHDLRRTFAGMLEEMGFSIEDISRLMRHSNIGTTSVYMEQNPRKVAELAAQFNLNKGAF